MRIPRPTSQTASLLGLRLRLRMYCDMDGVLHECEQG